MKDILKKKKIIVSILTIVIIAGAASSYAIYKSQTSTAANTFTKGKLKTQIEEDFEGDVSPGAVIKKTPSVVNVGQTNAFVRVRVTATPDIINYGNDVINDRIQLLSGRWSDNTFTEIENDKTGYKSILGKDTNVLYGEPDEGEEKIGWIYSDGYYYYNKPIKRQEKTEKVFSAVKIGTEVKYSFDVTVYQESVSASRYDTDKTYDLDTIKSEFSDVDKK